ncbi:DUF4168 domain-containing protein [Algoriphagus resistens]|uniref:DUF4168 domain-containing protein n=1 Tax=Algoriphagus resistens TaxID=1750590 RepID=UPI0007168311|nr:DUF4168 domain-containing protein [Algoriphagus resistens]
MKYLKKLKISSLALMTLCLMATVSMAQQVTPPETPTESTENFSEKEIETFVKINKEIMPLQENIQTDMVNTIEKEGMEVPRFQELAQAQQGGKLQEVSKDPKELEKFNAAGQKIMKLQENLQGEIEKVIDNNKMSTEKFEAIYMAYNSNPEIKQKVDKLFSGDT